MNVHRSLILLVFLFNLPSAMAAGASASVDFLTGDVEFDGYLDELSVHAGGNLDGFIDHLSVSYGQPRTRVVELVELYPPADVYLILGYSHELGLDVDHVTRTYRAHRGRGWGAIAQELGIQPGSEAFHAMKRDARSGAGGGWKNGQGAAPPGHSKSKNKGKNKGKGKGGR